MKNTRVFQLGAYPVPTTVVLDKKNDEWWPHGNYDDKEIVVMGKGVFKCAKWKRETIQPLSPFTARNMATVGSVYGYHAVLGMIRGWGANSLFHDQAYGLTYAKCEVANMIRFGEMYDNYTDTVQKIGDSFVAGLTASGFRIDGTVEKGTLWYGDNLTGFTDNLRIHPLQHVDHCLCGFPTSPSFNAVNFDGVLVRLMLAAGRDPDAVVSCKERIAVLTGNSELPEHFEEIFEMQKTFSRS